MNKLILALILLIVSVAPAMAKPSSFTVSLNQAQLQWRCFSGAFGSWTYQYDVSATTTEVTQTGNTLHTEWTYSPVVTDLVGQSTVYVYADEGLWIEREGQIFYKYVPGYGDYWICNFFRGYLEFNGEPSNTNFHHGIAYQWVYLYAPYSETPPVPNAVWHEQIGAWLVGFSTYLWDKTPQGYLYSFPDPFPLPVPAD